VIGTHPALWLLAKLKFRGVFRKQYRRLKSVRGAIFAFFGLLVFGLWFSSIALSQLMPKKAGQLARGPFTAETVQLTLFFLLVFTLLSSLGFRGLFLPKEEIELIFSSPVSRRDAIRYRLITNIGRSIFGGLIVGLFAMNGSSVPLFGFVGTFIAVQTLPVLSQGVSLLVGGAESKMESRGSKIVSRIAALVGALFYTCIVLFLVTNAQETFSKWMQSTETGQAFKAVMSNPTLIAVSSICLPWARMITATNTQDFLLWFSASIGIWLIAFEAVGRIAVDYRELSLQTSADIAKRINRIRKQGGASGSAISRFAAGWSVPWFFGRGRFGAIAWLKTGSIVRKARGTIIISIAVLSLITIVSMVISMRPSRHGGAAQLEPYLSIFVAFFGCIYLCGGLRFDFREDLDRMEFFKTAPAPSWVVFLANITPQTVFVSLLVAVALVIKSSVTRQFHEALLLIFPSVPLLTFTWIAIDNIVFLAAPTRYVSGQDTVLQNAGRLAVMMFVRFFVLIAVAATVAVPVVLGAVVREIWPDSGGTPIVIGMIAGLAVWFGDCVALVVAGAWRLRRFDVARDRT
jgi:hypothetical protein